MFAGVARAAANDEAPLRASVQRLAAAWNQGDGLLWVAEYWPDCDFVNILGAVLQCPTELATTTSRILAGPFKGSHFDSRIRRVQFLGGDVAIVDVDARVTDFPGLPPGTVATEPGVLLTHLKHIFQRRGTVWRIIASQNTAVLPRPDPSGLAH